MKEATKLSQAGRSSLQNWSQGLPSEKAQKSVINTFKAGSALNKQLMKEHPKQIKTVSATKQLIEQARQAKQYQKLHQVSQEEKLMAEVKNLSDFKPSNTREKTKLMVQQIIANKRQQHLKCLNQFLSQTQETYNYAKDIQENTKLQKLQFFKTNKRQFQELTQSLTDESLLKKDKSLLTEIPNFIKQNQIRRTERLDGVRQSLLSLFEDLKQRFKQQVASLKEQFRQIAFVLEDEATLICQNQLKRLLQLCNNAISDINTFVDSLIGSSKQQLQELKIALKQKGERWKQVNKQYCIEEFMNKLNNPIFYKTTQRTAQFQELKAVQQKVHNERQTLVDELFKIDPNSLSKQEVQKWVQNIKSKSSQANSSVDVLFNKLLAEISSSKQRGFKELEKLKQRLLQIGADQPSIILGQLSQEFQPIIIKNEQKQKELLSKAIEHVQKYESLQNDLCENIGKWMLVLGTKFDDHKKRLSSQKQSHQIAKAKILDEDEQKIDKLNQQLENYKKELKQSLHHPKLQELQNQCYQKVQQLEQHYRSVYESNKELIAKHPQLITNFYNTMENEIVDLFCLVNLSRRQQFINKVKINNQKLALKQIEKQDQLKAEQEAKIRQQESKKKGGKAPPPQKPKDPKKLAAQLQQRKQIILKNMGQPQISQMIVNGKTWIVQKDVQKISKQFYPTYIPDTENPPPVDAVNVAIKDDLGDDVVSTNVIMKIDKVMSKLQQYRGKVFSRMVENRQNTMREESQQDKKYLTESLQTLDDRLKAHYPLKSIIESEIIGKRSTEINSHKKRYERHARTTREKVDQQTQKFNLLMQKSLEVTKTYNQQRKLIKQELANVKNISNFQVISRKARQSNEYLDSNMKQILKQLKKLSESELDLLISKNDQFLKEINTNSQYAKQEIDWYTNMMSQISTQLKDQKQKRTQKILEIQNHTKKRKEELMQIFEKQYSVGMDDMAAKDCAGNKYGKPKMIAQERLRMEMSKCEKAQQNINSLIEELKSKLSKTGTKNVLQIRETLMTIRTCMGKYAKHIQAFKPDVKVLQMPRVNYALSRPDTILLAAEKEEDQKRKLKQLNAIGPLSQQKDERKYNPSIADITRIVKQQVAKIYIGDKAKFLNADKIPDSLQEYLLTIRKNAQIFRLNSIRDLRTSCLILSELSKNISQKIFESIQDQAQNIQNDHSSKYQNVIQNKKVQNDALKSLHMKKLSPNLANPASRKQLVALDEDENSRLPEFKRFIQQNRTLIFSNLFTNSSIFLNSLLNNFQFLILYFDSLYLPQDFIQLPGDQTNEKKHLNLKQLMLRKQKGTIVDNISQRNISKKWQGLKYDVFDKEENVFQYTKTQVQDVKDSKKAPKKEVKDPKKQQIQIPQTKISKEIQSIKTKRQKSAFVERNNSYERFSKLYNTQIQKFYQLFSKIEEQQGTFSAKWKETVDRLKKLSE